METKGCSCRSEFQVVEESDALVQETMTRLRPYFRRREAHQHAADYLRGLIADLERKNGWQLAEQAGYRHPRECRVSWSDTPGTIRRCERICASTW